MKTTICRGFVVGVIGIAIFCGAANAQEAPKPTLNVVGVVPLEGDLLQNQIVVFFDRAIVVPKPPEGQPPVPAMTFQPELPGDIVVGANFIAYKLKTAPKEPIYEVTLPANLTGADGAPLNPSAQRFFFQSIYPRVQKAEIVELTNEQIVVGLAFTVPVAVDAVTSHIAVSGPDGQPIVFKVEPGTSPTLVRLVLSPVPPKGTKITLAAGFTDVSGRLKLSSSQSVPLPEPVPLKVTNLRWRNRGAQQQMAVMDFSRAMDPAEVQRQLQITSGDGGAALPFSVQRVDDIHPQSMRIFLTLDPLRTQFVKFRLPKGTQSLDGARLEADYETTLTFEGRPVGVEDTWWSQDWQSPERGLMLGLRLTVPIEGLDLKDKVQVNPPITNMQVQSNYAVQITGDWDSKRSYEIRIDVQGNIAATRVTVEKVPEFVGFAREKEWYFPRRSGLKLPLRTRNAESVKLTMYRMFPSNAAVAVRDLIEERNESNFAQWCEELKEIDIPIAKIADRIVETPLDLDQLFPPDKLGVFYLVARGQQEGRASKYVVWTNMGILAHWQKDELALFVHDLFTLKPLDLAKVSIYSQKNQLLGTGNTNADGILKLGPFDTALGQPFVAVVEYNQDVTLLKLDSKQEDLKEIPADLPGYDRKSYDAYIYADRDLYRPGETIHAHWLIRTNYGDAPPPMPLVVTVVKPNGKDLLSEPTTLSDFGTGGYELGTQKTFPTGKYTISLSVPGSKKTIGSYEFKLEEFVPNRMKATVTIDTPLWVAANQYPIHLKAQHLFGAPASERKSEVAVVMRRDPITFSQWPGFSFGNDSDFVPQPVPCGEQTTDQDGNATFTFSFTPPPKMTFPVKTTVIGRVFELGGRPVAGKADGTYFPSEISLGLALSKAADGALQADVAAVMPDGQPAALDKVKVTIEKQIWNYYVRRYYDRNEPKWSDSFREIETQEVPLVTGRGKAVFAPKEYGYYRVRVHSDQTVQYSTASLYSYGTGFQPTNPARPSLIKVVTDKEKYAVGEEAVVRIESPFDGQGIVVLQGEEIQEVIPVAITGQSGTVRIPITRKQVPNVWIEATVIHAVQADKTQVHPFSSFAVCSVKVADPTRQLQVAFANLPPEMKPATQAQFEVDVKDSTGNPIEAELTLAAVDEGIHGITNYKSPDPLAYLMRPRRPDLRRANYYDRVAYDFEPTTPGGDAMLRDLMKRAATPNDNWIKPVALWSGTVKTDAAGHAVVSMQLPEFNGQLRLDAVACTKVSSGAQSTNIFVRRPYILQTSMPRFLLPNDTIQCRATLFNNSDAPCKATVSWTSTGGILQNTGSQALDVAAHGEASCIVPFTAGPAPAQGEIQWQAAVTDPAGQALEQLAQTAQVPVRTSAAYQSQYALAVLKPGETREFRYTNIAETPESELELIVSGSPLLRLQESLRYVAHYPYGCVEQTTSQLLPMYVLRQVWNISGELVKTDVPIDNYIQAGILRLFSMQTPDGGFSMWPGGMKPWPYGSVYALHFLTLAKNGREFPLPESNYESLRKYVRGLANDWSKDNVDSLYLRAYATYVLALGGDAEAIQQIPRFDGVNLPQHGRYLLAAALALQTQDMDRVKMYLFSAPSTPNLTRERSGTLNSDIRNTAVELLALRQMKMYPEAQVERAQALMSYLETYRYGSTQENAFIIAAMASYLTDTAGNIESAGATITTPQEQKAINGAQVYRKTQTGPGAVFTVANTGAMDLYVNVTTRGVPTTPPQPVSAGGLSIMRQIKTAAGAVVGEGAYKQASSYIIDLQIRSESELENVILADLLPAGFEVENPRLQPDAAPAASIGKPTAPAYVDLRDDRVLLAFDKIPRGDTHYYYIVRAITPGTYQYPVVQAECMYDASVNARSGVGTMKVE